MGHLADAPRRTISADCLAVQFFYCNFARQTLETCERPIRIFTKIDTRLMLEDLICKLHLTKQ